MRKVSNVFLDRQLSEWLPNVLIRQANVKLVHLHCNCGRRVVPKVRAPRRIVTDTAMDTLSLIMIDA